MLPRAPQCMKIFPLLKGDSALGEGARGMSNRPEQAQSPAGPACRPLWIPGIFTGANENLLPAKSLYRV